MPGWGVAATAAKEAARDYGQARLQRRASTLRRQDRYQQQQQGPRRPSGGYGIDNAGTKFWNSSASGVKAHQTDWRNIPDMPVKTIPKPSSGNLRRTVMQGLSGRQEEAAARTTRPMPTTSSMPSKAMSTAADLGRRFHFLHGVQNVPFASGEIGGMKALGAAPLPGSDMGFGKGGQRALPVRGYDLSNVQEDGTPWFPGQPDQKLERMASFSLGRSALALNPGPNAVMPGATGSAVPPRRLAGMNPTEQTRIGSELADVAGQMAKPLVEPKKRRPAGANPSAIKTARAEWPLLPGQPKLGI